MPRVSQFFGISIRMEYNDHNPPHFHAEYGDCRAMVGIEPLAILRGWLPPRVAALVREWASLHQTELAEAWELARQGRPLPKIRPLA